MLANDPPAINTSSRLVLLSLLDATLPVLYSIVAPHAIENLCVEPRSGRIFAARSPATTTTAAASSAAARVGVVGARGSTAGVGAGGASTATTGGAWGAPSLISGGSGSGDAGVSGAAAWSGSGPPATAAAAASSGERWMAAAEGAVSVLALASGSFLDRGPLRSVLAREVRGGSGRFAYGPRFRRVPSRFGREFRGFFFVFFCSFFLAWCWTLYCCIVAFCVLCRVTLT